MAPARPCRADGNTDPGTEGEAVDSRTEDGGGAMPNVRAMPIPGPGVPWRLRAFASGKPGHDQRVPIVPWAAIGALPGT